MRNNSYVIYGAGETGKQVTDILLSKNQKVLAIFDRNPIINDYRDIKIRKLDEWDYSSNLKDVICVMAIHNHYVDPKPIYEDLQRVGFGNLWNMIEFSRMWEFPDKYWLSASFSYEGRIEQLNYLLPLLRDDKSRNILSSTWDYWQKGALNRCPDPSLYDEYVPVDVPRYPENLRVIDCGASNGSTILRLIKAEYSIEAVMAFEPDAVNFSKLIKKNEKYNLIPLPLGLWSSNLTMNFSANEKNSFASGIESGGSTLIQCVSLDTVAFNFNPNLIKFDIEGSELEALHGAKKLIHKYKPNLCISVYHRPGDPLDILDLLSKWKLGYQFYLRCHEYNTYGLVLYCISENVSGSQ